MFSIIRGHKIKYNKQKQAGFIKKQETRFEKIWRVSCFRLMTVLRTAAGSGVEMPACSNIIYWLFYFIRMWTAAVASDAADGRDRRAFIIFVEAKIFLVDSTGHLVHMTGDVLFHFGIAREIEVM